VTHTRPSMRSSGILEVRTIVAAWWRRLDDRCAEHLALEQIPLRVRGIVLVGSSGIIGYDLRVQRHVATLLHAVERAEKRAREQTQT